MRAPLLACLILLAGCATVRGEQGPVALEQTQRVGPYLITPINLIADNRCAEGAQCDLPGGVIVRAQIGGDGFYGNGWYGGGYYGSLGDDGGARNFTLGVPAEVGRRHVVLDSVTPGRNAGTVISVAPYRFHFTLLD